MVQYEFYCKLVCHVESYLKIKWIIKNFININYQDKKRIKII